MRKRFEINWVTGKEGERPQPMVVFDKKRKTYWKYGKCNLENIYINRFLEWQTNAQHFDKDGNRKPPPVWRELSEIDRRMDEPNCGISGAIHFGFIDDDLMNDGKFVTIFEWLGVQNRVWVDGDLLWVWEDDREAKNILAEYIDLAYE
jgi:hypothetical protein